MIAVIGSFRLPPDRVAEATVMMRQVIAASLLEQGCVDYSYAEDVREPGLFRVTELWETRAALAAHFTTPHMREWAEARDALGFGDRNVTAFSLDEGESL